MVKRYTGHARAAQVRETGERGNNREMEVEMTTERNSIEGLKSSTKFTLSLAPCGQME